MQTKKQTEGYIFLSKLRGDNTCWCKFNKSKLHLLVLGADFYH